MESRSDASIVARPRSDDGVVDASLTPSSLGDSTRNVRCTRHSSAGLLSMRRYATRTAAMDTPTELWYDWLASNFPLKEPFHARATCAHYDGMHLPARGRRRRCDGTGREEAA